jgi:hypothetical protein
VECKSAIHGKMVAALLFYCKFVESLEMNEFIMNPYDPCVWNKIINGKQCTICFHVDNCKISHVSTEVLDNIIAWLREEYENVFTDRSRIMKVARGKVHKFLGMMLDFTVKYVMKVTMIEYVNEIIASWDKACLDFDDGFEILNNHKKSATPAPEDLSKVDDSVVKLGSVKAKVFHTIAAKGLYVSKRERPDASLVIAFLTTRVKEPDEDDWRKLRHLIVYLKSTPELPLVLGVWNTEVLHWYVDASFAVHPNMQGHTGGVLTLGTGAPVVTSTKQKLNMHSSTICEVVAVDDMIPQVLWTRLFMQEQGIKVTDNILYQDKKSAILLEKNGWTSSSKWTKHIKI